MTVNPTPYQNDSAPQTYNLEAPGGERQFFLANRIPPELKEALHHVRGDSGSGFANMTKADQIAVLNNIGHMADMQCCLLEQGETPINSIAGTVNHAQQQMGYGYLSPADIAILTAGYNGGLSEGENGSLDLDPFEAQQRREKLMNSYADGRALTGKPATLEEVEDFARMHGLNKDALLEKLADNNVEVENNIVPSAAEPAIGLANTGLNASLMTNGLKMSGMT